MKCPQVLYITGPPTTSVYSIRPHFLQPTTSVRMIVHSRYAKPAYNDQRTFRRLERWRSPSSLLLVLDILAERFDRIFSNEAGELSSPFKIVNKSTRVLKMYVRYLPWPEGNHVHKKTK